MIYDKHWLIGNDSDIYGGRKMLDRLAAKRVCWSFALLLAALVGAAVIVSTAKFFHLGPWWKIGLVFGLAGLLSWRFAVFVTDAIFVILRVHRDS